MKNKYLFYMIAFFSFGLADLFYLNSKVIPTLWLDKKLTAESAPEKTTKPKSNYTLAVNKPDLAVEEEKKIITPSVSSKTTYEFQEDNKDTKIEEKHTQASMVIKIVVQYKTGEYELSPDYRKTLLSELKKVGISDKISATIDGHADRRGTGFFDNKLLSWQRADFIAALLKQQGILEDKITAKGYGDSQPLDLNDTPEAYKKNRRAEIKIFKDKP